MLLRTRRNVALSLRIVCLLTVTTTFILISIVPGARPKAPDSAPDKTGKVNGFLLERIFSNSTFKKFRH